MYANSSFLHMGKRSLRFKTKYSEMYISTMWILVHNYSVDGSFILQSCKNVGCLDPEKNDQW